jgi:hypothetical protein
MHANTKQSMEEWIDVFTAAAAMRADDRLANELIGAGPQADGNALNSFSAKAKHQAGQVSQSVASSVGSAVTKTSDKVDTLLSCFSCLGRNSQEELWAAPFNANAAANSGAPAVAAAATHNPMQLLPAPRPAAHRGPMGAGQPIPRTVHNQNPFLQGGAAASPAAGPGSAPAGHRSVVNPLRPLQRSDSGSVASSSRITHNPMRSASGGAGGLMRQGYVLPDVSEDMDEDLRDDMDGPQDIEDNV